MKHGKVYQSIFLCVQCREIGYETHEEILRVLHELHTTMKTYNSYQGEYRQAENKLRITEAQRQKLEQSLPPEKLDRSKKYRVLEKEVQKASSVKLHFLQNFDFDFGECPLNIAPTDFFFCESPFICKLYRYIQQMV
jgi:hypothetical protein